MKNKLWLLYALATTISWGIWGAFIEIPERAGFPATLGYIVWALTMVPCGLIALFIIKGKLDINLKSILLGCSAGLLGSGGQLILFQALRQGPAFIVFPFISLYPVLTIFLSIVFLKEKASFRQWTGILIALIAIFFLSYQKSDSTFTKGYTWLLLSIIVFVFWGIQAYVMKFANQTMKAESIFFFMMISAISLTPVAFFMTDFSQEINWSFTGPYLAAVIQVLNAVGALMFVYALRYGKAIIVVPMTGLAPLITVVISLILYSVIPGVLLSAGLVLAIIAILVLSD